MFDLYFAYIAPKTFNVILAKRLRKVATILVHVEQVDEIGNVPIILG